MFQQIWHSILLLSIVAYAGYILNGSDPCNKSFRAGSVIRVPANAIDSLSSNWVGPETMLGIKTNANALDLWFEGVVKRTIYGNELVCPGMGDKPLEVLKSSLKQWGVQTDVSPQPSAANTATSPTTGNVTPVMPIDPNPQNLPSLP